VFLPARLNIDVPDDYYGEERLEREGTPMVNESVAQGRITGFWDLVGPNYESPENVATPGTAAYTHWVETLRSVLPSPPARVLDVGTGTGFVARIAAELGHQVTAIDLSEAMLDASSVRDSALVIAFAVGDAVDPDYPAKSFDVVINRSLLWTLREPERAFANWYGLLIPGGRVVAIYGLTGSPPAAQRAGHAEPTLFERHYTPETRAELTAMHLTHHDYLLHVAAAAGFGDLSAIPLEMVRGWETSPGSDLPYALVGYRASDDKESA